MHIRFDDSAGDGNHDDHFQKPVEPQQPMCNIPKFLNRLVPSFINLFYFNSYIRVIKD